MRSLALLAAALLLSGCSLGSGETRADERTVPAAETAPHDELIEIPVEAKSKKRPPRYALKAELEWAAAWARWEDRFSSAYDRSESVLKVVSRREEAVPGTKDYERLRAAMRAFRSCAEQAVARGAPPTRRLEPVAVSTAAVCDRVEKTAVRWEADGFDIGFPAEAILAETHLRDAYGALYGFVPGMELSVPLVDRPSRRHRTQIRYTYAASRLVDEQVNVVCHSRGSWRSSVERGVKPGEVAGFVRVHGASGNLAPVVCLWLDRLVYRRDRPRELPGLGYASQAVLVLAHEAQHAAGVYNEAKAECYAVQHVRRMAGLLGMNASYGALLEDFTWTRIYPLEPPGYSSPECRPGGALDLRKGVSAWPS
jgi:hypothetical protein